MDPSVKWTSLDHIVQLISGVLTHMLTFSPSGEVKNQMASGREAGKVKLFLLATVDNLVVVMVYFSPLQWYSGTYLL